MVFMFLLLLMFVLVVFFDQLVIQIDVVLKCGQGELFLLVEDDVDVGVVIVDQFQNIGYVVLCVENVDDVFDFVVDLFEFKGVLSDIIMFGQMNGLFLVWKIWKVRLDFGIVLMIGYVDWMFLVENGVVCEFLVFLKFFGD